MRRLGDIYGRICDYSNLLDAFGKVRRGKHSRPDIREWQATALTAFVRHADSYNLRGRLCLESSEEF